MLRYLFEQFDIEYGEERFVVFDISFGEVVIHINGKSRVVFDFGKVEHDMRDIPEGDLVSSRSIRDRTVGHEEVVPWAFVQLVYDRSFVFLLHHEMVAHQYDDGVLSVRL